MRSDAAALYLRSSKDRHDVSIDAQRRDLTELAAARGWPIVREYADVVLSGKDDHNRPAFLQLKADMKRRDRGWNIVLLLDWQRLARNQLIAHVFTADARQHGVEVIYARMPDAHANPVSRIIVTPLMHAFAEYYSWESKQKGLAGMRENVSRGFRAGGRAPLGYRLKHEPIGVARDGQPVLKSRLELDDAAPAVGRYLKLRAAGLPQRSAVAQSGVTAPASTLQHLEWNALTYAGSTVWNVENERVKGAHVGGVRRRPRAEWIVRDRTHEALITRQEAEAILADRQRRRERRRYRTPATYLLAGVLQTPEGEAWHGNRDGADRLYYRCRIRSVRSTAIEQAVLRQISRDLRSTKFAQRLARSARAMAEPDAEATAIARAYADIEELDRRIEKVTAMLHEGPQRPLLKQIEKWETEREKVRAGIIGNETRLRQARLIAGITEADVVRILERLAVDMPSDREALKDFILSLVKRVTLDPLKLTCRIDYEIPATGEFVASPRRTVEIPRIAAWAVLQLTGVRKAAA